MTSSRVTPLFTKKAPARLQPADARPEGNRPMGVAHLTAVPSVATSDDWYRDHRNLHELFCWLVDRGELDSLNQVGDFLDEPWKWRPEFCVMREAKQVGADIVLLSEMALKPWPDLDGAA